MSKSKLFASVAVAALMAVPAFAQTSSPSSSPAARPSTSAPSGAPATPRATLPSDIGSMKVSELVGKNVYTASDEKIGDVNDVVTSKSGGEAMAVIGVGGFLGIGEKEAAIPISQLKVQGDKIVASGATKDSLKQHADYKKDNYTKLDRDKMVSQAGSGMSTPSTGASGSAPTGSSGSSTTGSGSSTPPASGSTSGSSGMGGSSTGSGSATGSGSSSGSSTTSPSGSSTMGGSSGSSAPAGNAPSSGGSSTQTPKQ
jgi:sporulation protein YlmC with PRC-barrel domain